jgi:hypothetical protein
MGISQKVEEVAVSSVLAVWVLMMVAVWAAFSLKRLARRRRTAAIPVPLDDPTLPVRHRYPRH